MGDPSLYPEIRTARHMYALRWLPREIRDDRPLLQQWIDNNMSYLDARALVVLQAGDSDFRRDSWSVYMYTTISICAALACPASLGSAFIFEISIEFEISLEISLEISNFM